jgi:hypothetical protein
MIEQMLHTSQQMLVSSTLYFKSHLKAAARSGSKTMYTLLKNLILLVREERTIKAANYQGHLTAEQACDIANRISSIKTYAVCEDCGDIVTDDLTETSDGDVCPTCLEDHYQQCPHCDSWHRDCDEWWDVHTHNGVEVWCDSCKDNESWQCLDCEQWFAEGTEHYSHYDGNVCETCYDRRWVTCEHCEDITRGNNTTSVATDSGSEEWCEDCVEDVSWRCDDCAERISDGASIFTTSRGSDICLPCYDADYLTCEGCDQVIHTDDYGSGCRCTSCEESEDEDSSSVIQSYNTKAEDTLAWGRPDTLLKGKQLYFGMELEVEVRGHNETQTARSILDHCESEFGDTRILIASDGSLTGGFEIKTPPTNLKELKSIAEAVCSSPVYKYLQSHDGGRCGLHVHITRDALSQLQQGKIYEFINTPGNQVLVKALARRYSAEPSVDGQTNYTRIEPNAKRKDVVKAWGRSYGNPKKLTHKNGSVNGTRYVAVNFTPNTVEVRINRGTLKKSTLLACLEWVSALVCFTRTGEANAGRAETTKEFTNWLSQHPERNSRWGNLTRYLVDKGFMAAHALPRPKPEKVPLGEQIKPKYIPAPSESVFRPSLFTAIAA